MKSLVAFLLVVSIVGARGQSQSPAFGIYYQPLEPDKLRRATVGNAGDDRPAFNLTLAPIARPDGEGGWNEVWRKYLDAAHRHTKDLRCVLDVHVLGGDYWIDGDRLHDTLVAIIESDLASRLGGFYVCDEPFARSHSNRKKPADLRRVAALVATVRRAEQTTGRKQTVFADYASVFPLLAKGGDPINGGFDDYTDEVERREEFYWDGEWVDRVPAERSLIGREIRRRFGAFGEDVTLMNWWGDGAELRRWMPRVLGDVSATKLHIVCGYDTTADTPAASAAFLARTRGVIDAGNAHTVAGYWLWAWREIAAGGRRYKGVRDWWENGPAASTHPLRYADLVEATRAIKRDRGTPKDGEAREPAAESAQRRRRRD